MTKFINMVNSKLVLIRLLQANSPAWRVSAFHLQIPQMHPFSTAPIILKDDSKNSKGTPIQLDPSLLSDEYTDPGSENISSDSTKPSEPRPDSKFLISKVRKRTQGPSTATDRSYLKKIDKELRAERRNAPKPKPFIPMIPKIEPGVYSSDLIN